MLTWDQGTEMAKHLDITTDTSTRISFYDAASPWQRGSNENTNAPLRQYFPKSTNLSIHSARDLVRVETELNKRPRIVGDGERVEGGLPPPWTMPPCRGRGAWSG